MNRILTYVSIFCLALGLIGCGAGGEGDGGAAAKVDFSAIRADKTTMDAKVQERAGLMEQAAAGETQELKDQISALTTEIESLGEKLNGMAADYINEVDNAVMNEENPVYPPEYKEATNIISDYYIIVARSYITRQGNYPQAIATINEALKYDADYQPLKDALNEFETNMFMSEERFAAVKKDMTEDEVVAAIGRPNQNNIQVYSEQNARGWFYPKGEDRSAAGVFFQQKDGVYKVYKIDFNAVEAPKEEAAEE